MSNKLTIAELSRRYNKAFPGEDANAKKYFNFVIGHNDAEENAVIIAFDAVCYSIRKAGGDEEEVRSWVNSVKKDIQRFRCFH